MEETEREREIKGKKKKKITETMKPSQKKRAARRKEENVLYEIEKFSGDFYA